MRNLRNSKTSKLGCIPLLIVATLLPSGRLMAGKEELPTTVEDSGEVEGGTEVGVGKFFKLPFHVSVSLRAGYDDNVSNTAFDRQGSAFITANVGLTYSFGSPRTQLSLASAFSYTAYSDAPQDISNDYNPNLNLTLTHKFSPRLTLGVTSFVTYQQQPDVNNSFVGLNRQSGSFFYTTDKVSASYLWAPRFSTTTSYSLVALSYDDSAVGNFQDRTEHTFGNEFRFLLLPTTSLIAEYRFGIIAYANPSFQTRDSITHYILGGIDHSFGPRFNISGRAGIEMREYDNFGERTDPYAEATLIYALGPHLSVTWTNRYSLEEPDTIGSPSRTTFRTGLTARYNVTARIVAGLNAFWEHDSNDGQTTFFFVSPAFTEDSFSLGGTLRYAINRTWGIDFGYDFVDVESDIPLRGYYRNRFYGGVNLQF